MCPSMVMPNMEVPNMRGQNEKYTIIPPLHEKSELLRTTLRGTYLICIPEILANFFLVLRSILNDLESFPILVRQSFQIWLFKWLNLWYFDFFRSSPF